MGQREYFLAVPLRNQDGPLIMVVNGLDGYDEHVMVKVEQFTHGDVPERHSGDSGFAKQGVSPPRARGG